MTAWGEPINFYRKVVLTYEGNECLFWPYGRSHNRYATVHHEGASKRVSRMACEEVHGPAPTPKHEAAHSCGKGHLGCVTKRHLSWKTRKENEEDKLIHGTVARGEQHGRSKLTQNDVREILNLKGKLSQRRIAAQFGVGQTAVRNIHAGRRWGWLSTNQIEGVAS